MEINDHNIVEKDELTGDKIISGHEYDNIKELDNRLPKWWIWLFIITIVYAVAYVLLMDVFHVVPQAYDEYNNEMAAAKATMPPQAAIAGIDTTNLVQLTDPNDIDAGKTIWTQNCVVCHKVQGQGLVGPNLTDDFTIHGCSYRQIVYFISIGAPAKGMIAWNTKLSPKDIQEVASYIMTLHGTNPPDPKAPQGDPCK
jgi:cytochrome c oxidase cbb3-type subunit III